jgi:hypothetical protein
VVLDEADLLLGGGYARDTRRILAAFKEGDRARSSGAAAAQLGLPPGALAALPRHMRRAAAQGAALCLLHERESRTRRSTPSPPSPALGVVTRQEAVKGGAHQEVVGCCDMLHHVLRCMPV